MVLFYGYLCGYFGELEFEVKVVMVLGLQVGSS